MGVRRMAVIIAQHIDAPVYPDLPTPCSDLSPPAHVLRAAGRDIRRTVQAWRMPTYSCVRPGWCAQFSKGTCKALKISPFPQMEGTSPKWFHSLSPVHRITMSASTSSAPAAPPGNGGYFQNEPVVPPFTWIGRGGAGLLTSHGDQTVPDAAKQPLVHMTNLQINNANTIAVHLCVKAGHNGIQLCAVL